MSALFDELKRDSLLMAYAATGNETFLKDLTPMRNEPLHLPPPLPQGEPLVFDIHDDQLMRECIGGRLTKSVQALLITLSQIEQLGDRTDKEIILKVLMEELADLRGAVKDSFNDL